MDGVFYKALIAGVLALILGIFDLIFSKKAIPEKKPEIATGSSQIKPRLWLHKVFHYFFIPFRFIFAIKALLEYVAILKNGVFLEVILGFLLTLLALVFLIIAFCGLFRRMRYAMLALFAYFLADSVLACVLSIITCLLYSPENLESNISSSLGALVVAFLVCIYYWKRRALFANNPQPCVSSLSNPSQKIPYSLQTRNRFSDQSRPQNTTITVDIPTANNNSVASFCHKCGTKLTEESVFCHRCGTKTIAG